MLHRLLAGSAEVCVVWSFAYLALRWSLDLILRCLGRPDNGLGAAKPWLGQP